MDVVIMLIAIAEMMSFPSIPISVTINEFVEIAKYYSTPRSGGYVNGMLDAIARNLIATGRLMKHIDEPRKGKTHQEEHQEDVQDDVQKNVQDYQADKQMSSADSTPVDASSETGEA